jgi:uncharacterized OB-fold protein/NAD(P)-dependent dehydrogenase (short-subunit alcohol dehydrogenase family)
MIEPIKPPQRKNPLLRTRLPASPPKPRSGTSHGFTRAAAEGRLMLQRCEACGTFTYPAREASPSCLSPGLAFVDAPSRGMLLAETTARVPSDVYFRERAPWRIGLVKMDCGPTIVAHLDADCGEGTLVRMSFQLDKSEQAVAFARPEGETPNMADDRQWWEMTADPKFRRVLVTNGRSVIGQKAVAALKVAGANTVFVGVAEPWRPFTGDVLLRVQEGVEVVTLDAADEKSAADLAVDIGGKADILVNTTEYVRPGGQLDRRSMRIARDEIDQAYLGFINLAQAFGPATRMRGADGINNSVAWVHILSVYALANWPAFGAYSPQPTPLLVQGIVDCMKARGLKTVAFIGFSDAFGDLMHDALSQSAKAADIKGSPTNDMPGRIPLSRPRCCPHSLQVPTPSCYGGTGTPGALPVIALSERGYKEPLYGQPWTDQRRPPAPCRQGRQRYHLSDRAGDRGRAASGQPSDPEGCLGVPCGLREGDRRDANGLGLVAGWCSPMRAGVPRRPVPSRARRNFVPRCARPCSRPRRSSQPGASTPSCRRTASMIVRASWSRSRTANTSCGPERGACDGEQRAGGGRRHSRGA